MMKAEKNIPALRFPEFDGEWKNTLIKDIANKITDGTHDTPIPSLEGVPYITAIHVKDGFIDFDNCYFLQQDIHDRIYERCNPEKDDLLMVNIGAGTATSALVNVTYEFSLKNVALIKPNKKRIDTNFFEQVQRRNSRKLKHQISAGGAQPFLSLKEIGKLKLIMPPSLPEQQKISSFLASVDQRIHLLTQKKEKLEQYKKGIMQQIFSQQLRFKDENGKDYPAWEEKRLGDIAVINPRIDKVPDNFHYIDLESVDKGSLKYAINYNQSDAPSRAQRVLTRGDILFQLVRPYQKNNYYFDLEGTYVASTGYAQIRYDRCPQFVYQMVHSEFFVTKVLNRCTGSSYPAINSSDLGDITELFPRSFEEQQKIATFLSAIDEKINHINSQIELTRKWKQGLLQQMFV